MSSRDDDLALFARRMPDWAYVSGASMFLIRGVPLIVPAPSSADVEHMKFVAHVWAAIGGGTLMVHRISYGRGGWKVQFDPRVAIDIEVPDNAVAWDLSWAAIRAASNAMGFSNKERAR